MKIKKIFKCIINVFSIIGGIIVSLFVGMKVNNLLKTKQEEKNWKPIKNKPNYIELYENGKWKEIKLPKDKNGKQIRNNSIKTINISEEGLLYVEIKTGVTDRRGVADTGKSSSMEL